MKPQKLFTITLDVSDLGECRWFDRPYYLGWDTLSTAGDNMAELIENACIFTVDQDGGQGPWVMLTDITDMTRERIIHRIYMEVDSLNDKKAYA